MVNMILPRQCVFGNYSKELGTSRIVNEIIIIINRCFKKNINFDSKMDIVSFFII
jgi:hypothetical protein